MQLRPYQEQAIQRVREEIAAGRRRVLLDLATGGGKTFTSGSIIKSAVSRGKRCIFLAHRKELIDQCSKTQDFLGIDHGVIKRGHPRRDLTKPVQVASIQTLKNRKHWDADLIVIDEAHRSCAKTYKEIVARYSENVVLLGLSVGPKSFCEFRGGPFGSGWCGPIELAYKLIAEHHSDLSGSLQSFSTFDVRSLDIQSRGWDGKQFRWKKVKTFLRHKCDRDVSLIQVGGDRLLVTDDHSIYRAEPGEKKSVKTKTKYTAKITNVQAGELQVGDVCLLDDGADWNGRSQNLFDTLSLNMGLFVRTRFSDRLSWKTMKVSNKSYWAWKSGNPLGEYLPQDVYLEFSNRLRQAECVYTPGGNGQEFRRFVMLSRWAYIFGFYLGDGWTDGTRVNFAVQNDFCDTFVDRLQTIIPELNPIVSDGNGASKEVRCSHSIITNIFRAVTSGAKVHDKYIPGDWIMSWSKDARRQLLQGLIDSDGSTSNREDNKGTIYYTTTSRKLARSLLSLLRSLGISGSITIVDPKPGGVVDGRQIVGRKRRYTVHWSAHSMNGNNSGRYGKRSRFIHGDMNFNESPIRKIGRPTKTPKYVYDLEMDGHPSFVANGILVHNTATPYRLDGKPLGEMYDALVEVVSAQELIDDGYLIDPTVFGAKSVDLSKVNVGSKGDYNKKQLASAMSSTVLHGELLTNWARICGGALGSETIFYKDAEGRTRVSQTNCDACTVVFAPNVEMSMKIAEQFQAAGVRAEHLDGNTKAGPRRRIIEALAAGDIDVICNVDILTEGWDLPRLECILGARPTRSKSLYKQMGGRLMRPNDDARIKFLLDHANWTRTHGFLAEPSTHSLDKPEKRPRKKKSVGEAPIKECPQCKTVHPIGATTCNECGYDWPKREIEFTDEDLVQLDGGMVKRAHQVPQDERQEAFDRLAAKCVEKGHKPNWARVRYQSIYGEWPTKQTGIMMPHFFKSYERDLNKKRKSQMIAQAAANAASG